MLLDKSLRELHTLLKQKKISSVDLVNEVYQQIEACDSTLNVFITKRDKKEVLKQAEKIDRNSLTSILSGIPFVLKDAYATRGIRTTAASNVLQDFVPQYNATVYDRLLKSGAILIGKVNMDAWGHGASTENTDFGPTKNPWDLKKVAGGSSGGSAVAVATRMASFSIGEDTGGSIRNPAAWTNITGLKVTYGRVSRYGTVAYASSFDTVGPMAKTAEDCAVILEKISGNDPYDSTSSPEMVPPYSAQLTTNLKHIKIGIPKELYGRGLHPEIRDAILSAAHQYENLGVHIQEISMPLLEYALPVYYFIAPCETSSNLARYDGVRYGNGRKNFTEETMRRMMIGTYALSAGYADAFYKKALKVRTMLIQEYGKAFRQCDAILMPVTPNPPSNIGEFTDDPLQNLLMDMYTTSQNPVGVPSLALPCGFTKNHLPIGMQCVGQRFSEPLLLALGHQYQMATQWHTQKPRIFEMKNI